MDTKNLTHAFTLLLEDLEKRDRDIQAASDALRVYNEGIVEREAAITKREKACATIDERIKQVQQVAADRKLVAERAQADVEVADAKRKTAEYEMRKAQAEKARLEEALETALREKRALLALHSGDKMVVEGIVGEEKK
jgi:chromosome segregation ATPase